MNDLDQDKELADLMALRESYRHKAFMMMFEILFIFGIPALLGYFLGAYLQDVYQFGKWVQVVSLVPMFILSWVILIFRYKKLDRELKTITKRIKEIKRPELD